MSKNTPMIFLFYMASFLLFISSPQWFFLWVSLEMVTMTFICIMQNSKSSFNHMDMTSYFLLQSTSSMILVFSIMKTELSNLNSISNILVASTFLPLMLKMAAIPLHSWFPQLSSNMKNLPFLLIMTAQKIQPFMMITMMTKSFNILPYTFIMASSTLAPMFNIAQSNIKMILAYSSISHTAWMLTASLLNLGLWVMYFSVYAFVLSSILIVISKHTQQISIAPNKNLMLWAILMLSLAGLPPLLGFWPKFLVLENMFSSNLLLLTMIMIMSSVMDFFIYTRLMYYWFWMKKPTNLWKTKSTKMKTSYAIISSTVVSMGSLILFL